MRKTFLCWLVCACSNGTTDSNSKLLVSSAASLREVITQAAQSFEARHQRDRIQLNFGASGALRQQIEKGAPVDVFISASPDDIDKLRVPAENRRVFARNQLVVIGATDLLAAPTKKIAIGDPASVPAGKYAKQWLQGQGLWDKLSGRFVLGGDVRQVLDYVRRKEVDAGLVYATDARIARLPAMVAQGAPDVIYVAALLNTSGSDAARRFFEHLGSAGVQRDLTQLGFLPP